LWPAPPHPSGVLDTYEITDVGVGLESAPRVIGTTRSRLTPVPVLYSEADEEGDEPTYGGGSAVRYLRIEHAASVDEPTGMWDRFALEGGGVTDVGRARKVNEDAMLLLEGDGVFAVADGMGGHVGGEVASQLAVEAIASTFLEGPDEDACMLVDVPLRGAELVRSFAAANEAIRGIASKHSSLYEMGTTIVAARFCPKKGRLYVAHVGDSRCYRFRDSALSQLTRDHTLAEMGIRGKEARHLSRAVGPTGLVEADLTVLEPRPGDTYLLCSDGLTKMVGAAAISMVLDQIADPQAAARELVRLANDAGGRDNITAVVIRVVDRK
jgi:serine/threonine protein phosphatase PrpC